MALKKKGDGGRGAVPLYISIVYKIFFLFFALLF
jgi:hypothetical protein